MTVTDHIQWCPGKTICAKGIGSFIDLRWVSDRSVWLTPMHYGETGCTMVKLNVSSKDACINKSQTVLVDSCAQTGGPGRRRTFLGWDKHSITIWYNGMALVLLSMFFLGLGSWLLTVTWIETLILTLIHPSLYINSHTSISISYLHFYLNI